MTTTLPWSPTRYFDKSAHLQPPVPLYQWNIDREAHSARLESGPFDATATTWVGSVEEHSWIWNTHKGMYVSLKRDHRLLTMFKSLKYYAYLHPSPSPNGFSDPPPARSLNRRD